MATLLFADAAMNAKLAVVATWLLIVVVGVTLANDHVNRQHQELLQLRQHRHELRLECIQQERLGAYCNDIFKDAFKCASDQ
jgi:hypothetical protein